MPNRSTCKILIAEDNEDAQRLLARAIERFFKDKNVTVYQTDSLEEAIQIERIRGPMAVSLIDLELKDSKPDNTMKFFGSLGQTIIAMSGLASGASIRDCKRHGARDYVEKPIVIELLIEKIARVLDAHEPMGEFMDVQRSAQHSLQQKTTAAPAVVLSPVSSRWLKVILPATGAALVGLSTLIGFVGGSWRTAQNIGAERQSTIDTINTIQVNVKEIKDSAAKRDETILKVQLDVTKLLTKQGLDSR